MTFPFPIVPAATASAADAVITYVGNGVKLTSYSSPTTFSSVGFGTASADRYLIACVGARGTSPNVTAVTIGGVSATQAVAHQTGFASASIWIAAVPTGTSGNVVVTSTGATYGMGVTVHAVTGLLSATATDTATSGVTSPLSASIDIDAGGVGVAFSHDDNNTTATWTGLTEDVEIHYHDGANLKTGTAASLNSASGETGLSVTCTLGSYFSQRMAVAAFR